MPALDDPSGAGSEDSRTFWCNQLSSLKTLLYKTNKAIEAVTDGNHKSYKLDSGQGAQEVTRHDLDKLMANVIDYQNQIDDLEKKLGITKSCVVVGPAW